MDTPRGTKRINVAGTTLFRVAAENLGDARSWYRIAAATGLDDPWVEGPVELVVPPPAAPAAGNGGVLYPS